MSATKPGGGSTGWIPGAAAPPPRLAPVRGGPWPAAAVLVLSAASLPMRGPGGRARPVRGADVAGQAGAPAEPGAGTLPSGEEQAREQTTTVVPSGREFTVVLRDSLGTRHNRVGDRFTAVLRGPLRVDGDVAVPAGATVEGELTAVRESGSAGERAVLRMGIRWVRWDDRRVPLRASITAHSAEKRSRAGTATLLLVVAGAALVGGLIGRYAGGGGPGLLVGAAVAAAVGWAAVTFLHDVDVLLPAGSELTLRLEGALEVTRTPGR